MSPARPAVPQMFPRLGFRFDQESTPWSDEIPELAPRERSSAGQYRKHGQCSVIDFKENFRTMHFSNNHVTNQPFNYVIHDSLSKYSKHTLKPQQRLHLVMSRV